MKTSYSQPRRTCVRFIDSISDSNQCTTSSWPNGGPFLSDRPQSLRTTPTMHYLLFFAPTSTLTLSPRDSYQRGSAERWDCFRAMWPYHGWVLPRHGLGKIKDNSGKGKVLPVSVYLRHSTRCRMCFDHVSKRKRCCRGRLVFIEFWAKFRQ